MARLRAVLVVAAVVAACGDDDGGGGPQPAPSLVSVEEAPNHDGELAVVEGFLLAAPEAVHRLCSALAESYPPQCAGGRLEVVGLELARLPATSTNEELPEGERTVWTDATVALTGRIDGERLELATATADLGPGIVVVEAWAGPTCPVETDPPDPACARHPVVGARVELWGEDAAVASATTDGLGVAVFDVEPGSYQVAPLPVDGLTAPDRTTVTVGDATTSVQLDYDTGIR